MMLSVFIARFKDSFHLNNRRAYSLALLLTIGAYPFITGATWAQQSDFDKAVESYQLERYNQAIKRFSKIIEDVTVDEDLRRDAWRYLGRCFIVEGRRDAAREAIENLLELEPPPVEFDPDKEPPPLLSVYYEVRMERRGYAVERIPGLQTLAVMDFQNNSVDASERYQPLQKGLASMMINHLSGTTDLRVIERERVQWLLEEQNFQSNPERVDPSTAVQTGKLLGAHAVITGSYTVHEDTMWLNARLVDVETGEILFSEKVLGKKNNFFELVEDLSKRLAAALHVGAQHVTTDSMATTSLDAVIAYSRGLAELEEGDYQTAYQRFVEAATLDPDYRQARQKARSLEPLAVDRWGTTTSFTVGYRNMDFHYAGPDTTSPFDVNSPLFTIAYSAPTEAFSIGYGSSSFRQGSRQLLDISAMSGARTSIGEMVATIPLKIYLPVQWRGAYRYINLKIGAEDSLLQLEHTSHHLLNAGLGTGIGLQFRFPELAAVQGIPLLKKTTLDGTIIFSPGLYVDSRAGLKDSRLSRIWDINLDVKLERLLGVGPRRDVGITVGFTHRTLDRTVEAPATLGDVLGAIFDGDTSQRIVTQQLIRLGFNW